jgi:hypothetical protein
MSEYQIHNFNGRNYGFERGDDGFYSIIREDGISLGCSASLHGAFDAAVQDAMPRQPRKSLRKRPD